MDEAQAMMWQSKLGIFTESLASEKEKQEKARVTEQRMWTMSELKALIKTLLEQTNVLKHLACFISLAQQRRSRWWWSP